MASTNEHIKIHSAKRLNDIGEYYFSSKLRQISELNAAGKNIINLGIGSPDLPPHPSVIQALTEAAHQTHAHGYQSYRGLTELRVAFANWYESYYEVKLNYEDEILPLIGSKEGIMHICMTFLNEGDKALIPNPGYPTYTSAVKLAGGEPLYYSLTSNGQIDIDELERLNLNKAKLMWINYPHMPTGALPTHDTFDKLISFATKYNILLCHDNPYSFILNDNKPQSILAYKNAKRVAIELNSLSKSHNMAGWRVGVLMGEKNIIDEVIKFKSNMDSGMFYGLQKAAIQALSLGEEWFHSVNAIYRKRRVIVYKILTAIDCSIEHNQAGLFVWAKIPTTFNNAFELSDSVLKKYRVFMAPGGIFGSQGGRYIRLSLCAEEQKLHEALARIVS